MNARKKKITGVKNAKLLKEKEMKLIKKYQNLKTNFEQSFLKETILSQKEVKLTVLF
jgi:hypothetical protein